MSAFLANSFSTNTLAKLGGTFSSAESRQGTPSFLAFCLLFDRLSASSSLSFGRHDVKNEMSHRRDVTFIRVSCG